MKILTCNIWGSICTSGDGPEVWAHRKDLCARVIRSRAPDVICFQEMCADQFCDLAGLFPECAAYAMVEDACGKHPKNSIFYLREAFTCVSAGGYWLSERPHVAGSKSWASDCVRLTNWCRLEDNAARTSFRIINTHLDHISQIARENQAGLIVEDIHAYPPDYPQILTGDMNCDSRNRAIAIFKAGGWIDTYGAVHGTEDPGPTYHAFLGPRCDSSVGKMDWIFMRGRTQAVEAEVIRDSRDGQFPSDHYFVSATVNVQMPGRPSAGLPQGFEGAR